MKVPNILQELSAQLQSQGANAIIVGGAVRDYFLNVPIKDYDIEVYGLNQIEDLEAILSRYGQVSLVGKSFGVLKLRYEGAVYDFSFPRREQKIGKGHRGFAVAYDGELDFAAASRRRDFTINAMGYEIASSRFLDPYGGREDMRRRELRHIDATTFVDDPLRVYRAVQFVARFGYTLAPETAHLCEMMVAQKMLQELPQERVYGEFQKLLLQSPRPSVGFEWMRKLGILRYFPELDAIIGVPQSPKWHPEGDVWRHTMLATDKMVSYFGENQKENLKLILAVLCHDLGKATHTQIAEDKISAIGHDRAGVEPTRRLLYRLTNAHDFIDDVALLVRYHMAPSVYFRNHAKDSTIRKLATKVNIEELVTVARADFLGRTTPIAKAGIYEAGDWLLAKAKQLGVLHHPIKPLLRGRDLIAAGLKPSKAFKRLLEGVYQAQLEGQVRTRAEALHYLRGLTRCVEH